MKRRVGDGGKYIEKRNRESACELERIDQATKAVPNHEKLGMYEIYIARAAEIFGVPKTREIYEQAIESGLPDKDVKAMCVKYAELEKSLGEIDRSWACVSCS